MTEAEISEIIEAGLARGLDLFAGQKYREAATLYSQVLRAVPDHPQALRMGALALSEMGEHAAARAWAERAATVAPDGYKVYNNLGLVLARAGDRAGATAAFRRAVDLNPGEPFLHTNLAIELKKGGDPAAALAAMGETAEAHPGNQHVWFNYGAILQECGEIDRAAYCYERAITIDPGMAVAHYNLSSVYFLRGEYRRAWPEYEWRWRQFERFAKTRSEFREPFWAGEPLAGKTIVLYGEQGFGDTVMGCRFVRDLKGMGATVVLLVTPPLAGLLRSAGADAVVSSYDGPLDYHCSLLSVPGVLGLGPGDVGRGRYLEPTPVDDVGGGGVRVGVCWAGSPAHPNDRNRSAPLAAFRGLAGPGVRLYSLQKDRRPHVYPDAGVVDYCAGGEDVPLTDLSERMTDFGAVAGLIARMDVVVTVDTSIAHVAGAIGKRCLVLLPHLPDWRWGLAGADTAWYPSVRLCRQDRPGDWGSAVAKVKAELAGG